MFKVFRPEITASCLILSIVGSLKAAADETTSSLPPAATWWKQSTAVTWSAFGDPAHAKWLDFVKELGTTICDRGVFYDQSTPAGARANVAEYYHRRGLRVTSFLSIDHWRPDEPSVNKLIQRMRQQLDDGCDGVHLDMLFSVNDPQRNVSETDAAVRAVARMRDAVHAYRRVPQAIFVGNTWILDSPFSLSAAKLCDVAWIESWGHDDLEVVRAARVARSLDGYVKPTWYHWQPSDNEHVRVQRLSDLPKSLYASCLLEGAVFLCNYQYPVPLVHRDDANRQVTQWKMYEINPGWQQSVLQYARFATEHGELFRDTKPVAPVLVAFRADEVAAANKIMRDLFVEQIPFNVQACGEWPLSELRAQDVAGYRAVVAPDASWAKQAGHSSVYNSAATLLAAAGPEIRDFCRVQERAKVVTRTFMSGSRMLVPMKQYGYSDPADGLTAIGPLTLKLRCPRAIGSVTCLSPDLPGRRELTFRQQGEETTVVIPQLEYYNLLVVDVDRMGLGEGLGKPSGESGKPKTGSGNTVRSQSGSQGKWVDLLDVVDVARDGPTGTWKRDSDGIAVVPDPTQKLSRLRLPTEIRGSYDIEMQFTRRTSNQTVGMVLPVGLRLCNLELSYWAGEASGLSFVDNRDARDNPSTRKPGALENGRKYTVLTQVRLNGNTANIEVLLDGTPYISWSGNQSSLRSWGETDRPALNHASLYAFDAAVTYHRVRFRSISE